MRFGRAAGLYFILHPSAFILGCALANSVVFAQPDPAKPVRSKREK